MFGPNQVGEVIIGDTYAGAVNLQAFLINALPGYIQAFSASGSPVTANSTIKFYQGTAGDPVKNLNFEFSDTIYSQYIEKVTAHNYVAEVQKQVTYTVVTATPEVTYEAEIVLYNDGGSLSPENFAVIQGFYVSGAGDTTTTIRDGLVLSLNQNLIKRGNSEFVVATVGAAQFTVTGKYQDVVPGKIIGKQIEFSALGKSFSNAYSLTALAVNLGLLTVATTVQPNPGNGTGKQAVNYEWFVKGYKYDPAREVGYPANFDTPYYADKAAFYDTINIIYYMPRKETSVERQYKVLTIFAETPDGISSTVADLILAEIATAVDGRIPVPVTPTP
jgi:hypothetical protein